MAITPADIEQKTFSEAKKHGYDTEEVDEFLDQLSAEVDAMLKKIKDLKDRLTASEQQNAASQAQISQLKDQLAAAAATPAPVVQPTAPTPPALNASESQISRVLIIAQQSADQLVEDARNNIRNEADRKAREVIRQALAEKQNELDEIDRLKQSREDFRSEYKKLLQHFMDDADAVFPEQALTSPTGSAVSYSTPAPQPAPNATVYAPAPMPQQTMKPIDDFDDFGDLD